MKGMLSLILTMTFCILAVWGFVPRVAQASFSVSPVKAELSPRSQSILMTVRNPGSRPVRVQARVFEWEQDANGKEHLTSTQDIAYFPQMLQVNPGDSGSVRLGLRVPVADREKSYRVIFEELPGTRSVEGPVGAQVMFRQRLSIPVFVTPARIQHQPRVSIDRVAGGRFQFSIHNDGNAHFLVRSVEIKGLSSSSSNPLLNGRLDGWYVLPGTPRRHVLRFPQGRCAEIDRLQIKVETTEGTVAEEVSFPRNTACVG